MHYGMLIKQILRVLASECTSSFNSVDEVPGLARTIDEAVSLFKPFNERLKNMEDDDYERRFCKSYKDGDKETENEKPEKVEKPRWGIGWLFDELR